MPDARSARIHPTAVIAPEAELADDVVVGPFSVIEGPVRIGPACVLRPYVHLIGPLTLGQGNQIFSGAVLGEQPQDFSYRGEPTGLEIGDQNVFREHVTIHRGTKKTGLTRIGSHNYLMAGSHVAHDCRVGNRCILANCALVAGHCVLEDNVYLSGNTSVHQFVRIGRLALLSGNSATGKDIPPFIIQQGHDTVSGVNVVGMRRAGLSPAQIDAVRQAFHILFRNRLVLSQALSQLEKELGQVDVVQEMIAFIRQTARGINSVRDRGRGDGSVPGTRLRAG